MECAASIEDVSTFDPTVRWQLDARVALRPERFGALAYHFGTRRLSFLKTTKLVRVVEKLADESTARNACVAAGVTPDELPAYENALASLADGGIITRVDRS